MSPQHYKQTVTNS